MTAIDTAALRELADARDASGQSTTRLFNAEVRALCDGYDEAQRLRAEVERLKDAARQALHFIDGLRAVQQKAYHERDAARQALAVLVADLRSDATVDWVARQLWHYADDYGAPEDYLIDARMLVAHLIDRHAPATPTTED